MRVKSSIAVVVASGLILTGLAACSPNPAKTGDQAATVLNIGMPDGATLPANNNPYLDASFAKHLGYSWLIWEPLALQNEAKPTEDPKPWLATKWDWSKDFSSVTFRGRDKLKCSAGSPLTADDGAYSFQIMKDNKGVNYYALPIKAVSANGNQVT